MFKRPHLILGQDNDYQFVETIKVSDARALADFVERKQLSISPKMHLLMDQMTPNTFSWESFANYENRGTVDAQGLDLMKRMLNVDPEKRISVRESLDHPFFYF